MNKFNHIFRLFKQNKSQIVSSFLLSAIVTNSYPYLLNDTAIALELPTKFIAQNNKNEAQSKPNSTSKSGNRNSILESIWKLLRAKREQEPALSSRSNICEISPGLVGEINVIYSDRPLFLWQGIVSSPKINLYGPFSPEKEQEILWSQTLDSQTQHILYGQKALEPGQIYDWEIIVNPDSSRRRISFQVMEKEKRDRISRELEELEKELTISGATVEEIILERANYFANQNLWSDAIQELFFLNSLSPTFSEKTKEIGKYLCES